MVGLMHAYVHLAGHGPDHQSATSHVTAHVKDSIPGLTVTEDCEHGHDHDHDHAGGMSSLFAGHDDDSAACMSFDQLGHFDVLMGYALPVPLALIQLQLVLAHGLAVARWHAQFQARGPPISH